MKPCKHKYQARYNEVYSTPATDVINGPEITQLSGQDVYVPYLKSKTYVHDICIECGDIKK